MGTPELQTIRFEQWHGWANDIGKFTNFLKGESITCVHCEDKKLTLTARGFNFPKVYELSPGDYLVYSNQTGYVVVTENIFNTFVKK